MKSIVFSKVPVYGKAWGGGNRFLTSAIDHLSNNDKYKVYQLTPSHTYQFIKHIDIFILMDVSDCTRTIFDGFKSRGTKIIHRIGNVGTHRDPDKYITELKYTIPNSDAVIYVSDWAKVYCESRGAVNPNSIVIPNAPDLSVFKNCASWNCTDKLNIVTHHWSTNSLKGFNLYKELDDCLSDLNVNFTYIGRLPDSIDLKNTNYVGPKTEEELPALLAKHHIYITASKFEAGANHVLEGIACGLPILYHKDGGSIPEYCKSFGHEYKTFAELVILLQNTKTWYNKAKECVDSFDYSNEDMIKRYIKVIRSVYT